MTGVDLPILLPEIVLALYAMAALLFAVYTGKDALTPALTWATVVVFIVMAAFVGLRNGEGAVAFGGMFNDDAFARFAKVVVLLSAAGVKTLRLRQSSFCGPLAAKPGIIENV